MPGATNLFQFPYPVGSDAIKDGDNTIAALAQKVEEQLSATGTSVPGAPYRAQTAATLVPSVPANGGNAVVISFTVGRFTQTPVVQATAYSNGYGFGMAVAPSTASFTGRYYNPTATVPTSPGIQWLAVQMSPTSGAALRAETPPNYVITCRVAQCDNQDAPIEVHADPTVGAAACGACGSPITDIEPVPDADHDVDQLAVMRHAWEDTTP